MFEMGPVILEKFGFEKNGSSNTGQLYVQSYILFSAKKFEATIKLAKPLMYYKLQHAYTYLTQHNQPFEVKNV